MDACIAIRKYEEELRLLPVSIIALTANDYAHPKQQCLEASMLEVFQNALQKQWPTLSYSLQKMAML
jgi:CheY-like chemotaxis protein